MREGDMFSLICGTILFLTVQDKNGILSGLIFLEKPICPVVAEVLIPK